MGKKARAAVAALRKALKDDERGVRMAAREALKKIDPKGAK
jgi:hypothetical protein